MAVGCSRGSWCCTASSAKPPFAGIEELVRALLYLLAAAWVAVVGLLGPSQRQHRVFDISNQATALAREWAPAAIRIRDPGDPSVDRIHGLPRRRRGFLRLGQPASPDGPRRGRPPPLLSLRSIGQKQDSSPPTESRSRSRTPRTHLYNIISIIITSGCKYVS